MTKFTRIKTGLKKGWATPTLPDNILKLQNNTMIRIFRALGGLSFIIILGRTKFEYPDYVLYFFLIFALFFTIYHFIITFFRFKHIYTSIKKGDLEIRNSPLDRLASLCAKAIFCAKGVCDTAQPIGLTLGIMLGTDEVLKNANRQPLFGPFLGGMVNAILPENLLRQTPQLTSINKTLEELKNNKLEQSIAEQITNSISDSVSKNGLSAEECRELQIGLLEHKALLENNQTEIVSKIKSQIEELKKGK